MVRPPRPSGGTVSSLLLVLLVTALSALVAWPLWRLATGYPGLYSAAFGAVLLALVALGIGRRAAGRNRRRRRALARADKAAPPVDVAPPSEPASAYPAEVDGP